MLRLLLSCVLILSIWALNDTDTDLDSLLNNDFNNATNSTEDSTPVFETTTALEDYDDMDNTTITTFGADFTTDSTSGDEATDSEITSTIDELTSTETEDAATTDSDTTSTPQSDNSEAEMDETEEQTTEEIATSASTGDKHQINYAVNFFLNKVLTKSQKREIQRRSKELKEIFSLKF